MSQGSGSSCRAVAQESPILVAGSRLEPSQNWYAVYTNPRHEKRIRQHLESRSIDSFLPLYHTVHRWKNGCKMHLELPLFPNYLFVRISPRERIRVLEVPGVISLVGSSREPKPLADVEIESLRSSVRLRRCEPHPYLAIGTKVRVAAGPLVGMKGILIRRTNGFRVVLTLDLIRQSVAVEVDASDLEPIDCRTF